MIQGFFIVNNLRFNNACRATTNNTYKDHDLSNKKLILNKHTGNTFTVFHQNICGLPNKKEELLNSLTGNSPQIISITEHHPIDEELEGITLHPYTLGAKFCRQMHKCGGVCIFIQDNIHFTNINMDRYSIEKVIEICFVKLRILSCIIVIITVYTSPSGNIAYFLSNLEAALNQIYSNTVDIILCGDFNVNYLSDNQNKQARNPLLTSYSLYSVIDFPMRIHNSSNTMIVNIFINKLKNENYLVYSLINGLSNHDAQVLSLSDIIVPDDRNELYSYREISTHSLNEFQTSLSYEAWENVFSDNDTNTTFNNFLNIFIRTFNASFPKKRTKLRQNSKAWLTAGIKTSCNNKRKLYLLYRESNDPNLKIYYNNYCKILSKVIILAKKMYHNNKLVNSTNKPKTTWSIIKTITNNKKNPNDILMMEIDGKITTHHQTIAEEFNNYYVSVADNITNNNPVNITIGDLNKNDPLNYLYSAFQQYFTNIKLKIQLLVK